jgi:hypothetical protein
MGPKRKRPPSGVLILTTGRTDQIAHDLVLADLRLMGQKPQPDSSTTANNYFFDHLVGAGVSSGAGTVKLSGLHSGWERTNRPLSPSTFFAK